MVCENAHDEELGSCLENNIGHLYYRFNAPQGMWQIMLDEWANKDDIKIYTENQTLYHDLEKVTTRAVDLLEAVVEAKDTSDRNAAYEIARLQSIVAEEQHTSRHNKEKMTRDISRLDSSVKEKDEAIANMGFETHKLTKEVYDLTNEATKLERGEGWSIEE